MPDLSFDRYYRYDDLTAILRGFAEEYPTLIQMDSIGQSYEGRDIWLITATNTATGPAEDKPALWVDGNIHASEVSPSSACLHLLHMLTSQHGTDEAITRALDTRTFYVVPRINPDGAEWALADEPKIIRSSTRPYPYDEDPIEGLVEQDIDGDGRILTMRIPDPNGPWKKHPDEPRLMVRRDPTETGGEYYFLINEGMIDNYDGVQIKRQKPKEGLDLNRNFPANWRQEAEQMGAGFYPGSEPETHAIIDFIARHPNITGAISFHTWSGVILRPYDTKPDEEFAPEDLWAYQKIGDKGTELTGYPNISVFHDFRYHPKQVITGGFDEWMFDHMGVFAWTVEIWSPQQQAGIEDYKFIDWYREHPVEDDLKMLQWSDDVLDGKGYVEWYEVEHPQLGTIELGGWDRLYCWRNPPPQFLEAEIAPFSQWLVWHALISPQLSQHSLDVEDLGNRNYRIRLAVENSGWLPTNVTKQATKKKVSRGLVYEIDLPQGVTLHSGQRRSEGGELAGRANTASSASPWSLWSAGTAYRHYYEWVVQAPDDGDLYSVTVTARHDRAGKVTAVVNLY